MTNYTTPDDDTQKFTPLSLPVEVVMFHPVSHKRMTVVRHSMKYRAMIACGWVELK